MLLHLRASRSLAEGNVSGRLYILPPRLLPRRGQRSKAALNRLWAIPQGGDVLRQHTASGIFIDEAAFQPDLEKSIRAAQPMLKGGGRIDCVSSAEPAYFQLLRGYPLRVFSRVGSAASRRRMVEYWPWSAMQKSKGSPGFRKGSQN